MNNRPSSAEPDTFERFRAIVLADDGLQMELARIEQPVAFFARAVEEAARRGIRLGVDDLQAAYEATPVHVSRTWPSPHWLPVRADGAAIDWAHFAGAPLAEPFFALSSLRASSLPFNRVFGLRTPFDAFIAGAEEEEADAPDGFTFHMSRCGSTLLGRMLAALPGSRVLFEPPPLDAIVQLWRRGDPAVEVDRAVMALRAMVGALSRRRSADDRRCFVKLDSWHVLAMPLFRRAFPEVPWLFLYRDPVEVLVSHERIPGMHTVAGVMPAERLGLVPAPDAMPLQWSARVLGRICEAAVQALELGGGLAINYADLPGAAWPAIAEHFGISSAEAAGDAVAAAGRRDAKSGAPFAADSALKQSVASEANRQAAEEHLAAPYRRLEALGRRFARPC